MRISNLVPSSVKNFSIQKHLCRGDVILHANYMPLVIKWSKTLQQSNQGTFILLPKLHSNHLCSYKAFQNLIQKYPGHKDSPLISESGRPLTECQVRTHLKSVLQGLGSHTQVHSFHTFRRSGATLAFNLNVNMSNIKRHGTWRSDSVYAYVVSDPTHASGVAAKFQQHFNNAVGL